MDLPKRKLPRLKGYDYSTVNYYYVTICTAGKAHIFGQPECLSHNGRIAEEEIQQIPTHYGSVKVDKYVVMPNHIHMIVVIGKDENVVHPPTLSAVIGSYKSGVSRRIHEATPGLTVWQKSFYDSVIRNEQMYREIWNYIDGNPMKWEADEH